MLRLISIVLFLSPVSYAIAEDHCESALASHIVCESADVFAADFMRSRRLEAATVVQDVKTGALVVFASSQSADFDVSTLILPLSVSKVFLAASWWDHHQPESTFETNGSANASNPAYRNRVNSNEMLVGGSDLAGRQMAVQLRKAVGEEAVLADLHRYGFNTTDEPFWAYLDPAWRSILTPPPASARLQNLDNQQWGAALSIGETHMTVTLLQVSRFMQAVGNDGVVCSPVAIRSAPESRAVGEHCIAAKRIIKKSTARRLQTAFLDTVKRGSASQIADAFNGTGWSIGGKTGTGGRPGVPLDQQDGIFAGVIFDRQGNARFTVATFVRGGGVGGGNAAEISAALGRFLANQGHH
jgi:cell division protein FtsI/penicillin-binding protein 2